MGVLDKKGVLRMVKASGVRIFFPKIKDLGILRQRYPIAPVYGEGSAQWKELNALKDIVMDWRKHTSMFYSSFDLAQQ